MTESNPAPAAQRRNRAALLVVLVMFFGGMLVAGALRFSGWRPDGMKNKGEMLQPYVDLRAYSPTLADGRRYAWHDSPRTWRIVAMPRDCDGARRAACTRLLGDLDKVWRLMGRNADRVHVLWAGAAPVDVGTLREVHLAPRRSTPARRCWCATAGTPRTAIRSGWWTPTVSWCCVTLAVPTRATCAAILRGC